VVEAHGHVLFRAMVSFAPGCSQWCAPGFCERFSDVDELVGDQHAEVVLALEGLV
jgi:hypothetical protein